MQKIEIIFDEISQIERIPQLAITSKRTVFNFSIGSQREFGVMVLGWPDIKAGIRYSCLLKDARNWQTLVGWKNLETGEIAGPVLVPSFFLMASIGFFSLLCGFAMDFDVHNWMASSLLIRVISIVIVLSALVGIWGALIQRRVKATLENL